MVSPGEVSIGRKGTSFGICRQCEAPKYYTRYNLAPLVSAHHVIRLAPAALIQNKSVFVSTGATTCRLSGKSSIMYQYIRSVG